LVREVELKARVDDSEGLLGRIKEAGGVFLREVVQEDYYFKHPCWDFKEKDEALRLRREGAVCILTFKGPRLGKSAKVREELEVRLDDFKGMAALLQRLGFEKAFTIKKRRSDFSLEGATISVDSVEGLGEFVEIEVLVRELPAGTGEEAQMMENLYKLLGDIAERLKVPRDRLTTESYLEMLASESSRSRDSR
jgi:adenylate cyclase class 2